MTRAERDRRAGAMLKARAAMLREIAREVKRLGRPNAEESTREERMVIAEYLGVIGGELYSTAADLLEHPDMTPEASAAQKLLRSGIEKWERLRAGPS